MEADKMIPTVHGMARLNQSGIRPDDRLLILAIATEVESGLIVTQQDYQAFERRCKKLIDQARRLVGMRLVTAEDRIVTAYHASRRQQRRLLRPH
jgi:hypothetical protein